MFEYPVVARKGRAETESYAVAGGFDFGKVDIDFGNDTCNVNTLEIADTTSPKVRGSN